MLNKESFVKYGILISACVAPALGAAQTLGFETIKTVRESDPLIITGAIGTQSTFYHSSSMAVASPLTATAYANLNISLYGISMPFSFYYSSDNTSFAYPQFAFSLTPTYKGWTLLMGERSMQFSPYVYNVPFNGVGIEYQGQGSNRMRFGAFYGTLRRAINDDPDDPSARNPQYRRTGWGVKVGYGSSRNYIDLYLFRAKDHQSSIDEVWYDQLNAQENVAAGLRGRLRLGRHFDLSANLAASLYSTDITAEEIHTDETTTIENLITPRYTTNSRLAGDVSLSSNWRYLSANFQYKQVQPDYTTLGVNFLTTNYQSLSASVSSTIKSLTLQGSFSGQNDNLDNMMIYTTNAYVYSGGATYSMGEHFNVSADYTGYHQFQEDGTMQVNDTTRDNRIMNSYSLSPMLIFNDANYSHNISLTGNYTSNDDLNPFSTGESDVKTLAVGLGYSLGIQHINTNLSANVSYQSTDGYDSNYKTTLYSLTATRSMLKDKNLQASASMSLTDNQMNESTRNISLGGMLNVSYTLLKVHSFSFNGSYNRYRNTNMVVDRQALTNDNLRLTLAYTYTFQAFHISKKGEDGKRKYESDWYHKKDNSSAAEIRKAVGRSERQQAAMRAIRAQQEANGAPKKY